MNRVRILIMAMFLSVAAFGFGQDTGQQPDATNQQERQHPPEAPPPTRPGEVHPPAAQPPQEKPQKPEKQEIPKPSKEQPQTGREEHQKPALGAHLLGDQAEETINLFAVAIRSGMRATDLSHMVFSYPTHASDLPYML
jgi:outer membrane biosynthesis protein TonB